MSQLALDGLTPEVALTDRQAFALTIIRQHAPIRSEVIGAYLCERTGRHSHLDVCEYDTGNGRDVAESLHRKSLVRYVRREGWVLAGHAKAGKPSSQLTEIPEWF